MVTAIKKIISPYRGLPKEVYVVFISRIVNALGCFVFPLLTIILTKNIGLTTQKAGFYLTISGLLVIPFSMAGGKLADTIGRKKVIIIGDFLAAFLYIVCGIMKPSIYMIFVLMFAACFMNLAGPAHDSLLADVTTKENRSNAYSLSYLGWNIGFAVGPVLGGMLYEKSLPLVFIGDASTALLSLLLIVVFIRETFDRNKEKMQTDISEDSGEHNLERAETGSIFSVLLKRPILIYFALIAFGYNFMYSQWSFLMPMDMMDKFSGGAKYFGLAAGFNGVVVMFFTPLVNKLLQNVKDIRGMIYGGLLYTIGFGMLGFFNTLPCFFISVFIFTIGEIVLTISINPFIQNHTPSSHRGRMSAVIPMLMGFGYSAGPLIMGIILKVTTISAGWLVVGVLGVISSAFMYALEKYDNKLAEN